MATYFTEQVEFWVKQLVRQVTNLEETSESFKSIESNIKRRLLEADSMVFSNRDDVDRAIASFGDKYIFHGFCDKAEYLKRAYEKYMATSKIDHISQLNVVKFLMCMSDSPTRKFEKVTDDDQIEDEDEISDWGAYLREGIERWMPKSDSESSDWSTDSACSSPTSQLKENLPPTAQLKATSTTSNITSLTSVDDYQTAKENLLSHVQNGWFDSKYFRELPESDWPEANTVNRWESHLEDLVQDLIPIPKSKIISEYKVMREVLWQLWGPHDSFVFQLDRNKLKIKPNVTISSVRLEAFENYMSVFLPHVELIDFFKDFCNSTNDPNIPDTYRSYSNGVNSILNIVKRHLVELERKVAQQEDSMTLIKLEKEIREILKPLMVLKQIHHRVVISTTENTSLFCSTNLLVKLHENLLHSHSKLHQDLCLALYLNTVFKYMWVIENWLTQDYFQDGLNEFPIVNKNSSDFVGCLYQSALLENLNNTVVLNASATDHLQQDWQMEFLLQEMSEEIKNDGFIKLICNQVLGIGKNVHLLHLLGKLHLVCEATGNLSTETVHEEFSRRILEEIKRHFNTNNEELKINDEEPAVHKQPIICPDDCKKMTDWDRLENLVDVEDGFLMKAFQPFFSKPKEAEIVEQLTLFEEISNITKSLFPAQNLIEKILADILEKRFKASGQIVKNLLLTENNLERYFEFLNRVYLFKDDFVFFFYKRLFRQFDFVTPLENYTRLTSYFRDQIMDVYPEFCDSCTVKTAEDWKSCRDPLTALRLVNIRFVVKWPINIVIRAEHLEMYYEIFEFNMKIKWALHTLGHLSFNQIPKIKVKAVQMLLRKLQVLRFKLLNIFSTIQRYVFGYIYPMNLRTFEVELDRSHDVNSMMTTHGVFITTVHRNCMDLKNYKSTTYGFQTLLHLVNKLALMWNSQHQMTSEELDNMDLCYKECVNSIDHFVIPTYYVL